MIWWQQAAMGRLYTPWSSPNLLARYEVDYPGVDHRLYDATTMDRLYSIGTSDASKTAAQDTAGNMPIVTPNNADFGGHGSWRMRLSGINGQSMPTGNWASPPGSLVTFYCVSKFGVGTAAYQIVFSGKIPTRDMTVTMVPTSNLAALYAGTAAVTVPGDVSNRVSVIAATFNGANSTLAINSLTPIAVGDPGAYTITGLSIGAYCSGAANPHRGETAHISAFAEAFDPRKMAYICSKYGQAYS